MLLDDIPIKRRSSQTPPPDDEGGRVRLILLAIGVIVTFALLSVRLYDLQVNKQQDFSQQVNLRSVNIRALPATRGLIYDRMVARRDDIRATVIHCDFKWSVFDCVGECFSIHIFAVVLARIRRDRLVVNSSVRFVSVCMY